MSASPAPPMRGTGIRILPPDVAARIAAGEVVERPVSVVRELLDNAIDAGATRISVAIAGGGVDLIRVVDDGHGIPPEQLELAFERHATSKISDAGDLAHVHTLGFRGEALPSIAAAGDVEIVSRAAQEPVAVHAVLIDAHVVRRQARPAPVGTSFAVSNLFGRLPARRKFLSSASAEARQVAVLVSHYALAYPEIAFNLESAGRGLLATPGDGDLRHAFGAVHGADAAAAMLTVEGGEDGVDVSGLASPPALHRGNRAAVSVFVNGRWVQSRPLVFAIVDAYQSQLPVGRHPLAALTVRLADEDVDVNVHPAKAEVRFRSERPVARAVRHAVAGALEGTRPVAWSTAWAGRAPSDEPSPGPPMAPAGLSLRARLEPPAALQAPAPVQARMDLRRPANDPETAATQREVLPLLRVVGQMALTYVVAEGPDGMYLIDQHAAHERVVYDRLIGRPGSAPASQPLLEPVLVELEPAIAAAAVEHLPHLLALSFEAEEFGDRALVVRAIPSALRTTDVGAAVHAILEKAAGERRLATPFDRAAASVACHASVRAGAALSLDEMRRLVEDLERAASPRTCPHGRPTLVHVGRDMIERQFGRR